MRGITRGAGPVAAMFVSGLVFASCTTDTGASPQASQSGSALSRQIAQIEASESKWKGPDAKLADEANALAFSKDLGQEVEKALKRDLPGAVLGLREVVQKSKGGPNPKQREWLESQISILTPDALAVLGDAFTNAKAVLDLRGMLLAQVVADKIRKDSIPNAQAQATEVRQKVLTGAGARYYWLVTNAAGTAIGDSYSEQTGGGNASVAAKEGQHLLRVSAAVKNLSTGQDPPYVLNVFSGIKGSMASIAVGDVFKETLAGPYRWLDQEFIFLINSAGEMIPCGFMPQGSALRNMPGELAVGGIGIIPSPRPVKGSEEISNFEGIFPVPNQEQPYKLLVLGAAPVLLKLTAAK